MAANRNQIQTSLHKPYDRILFSREVLSPVFGSDFSLSTTLVPASAQPNKSEQEVIETVSIYGNIILEDKTEVTCYEIILQPKVRIEQSKVAIQRYVRKLLTAGQAALVNFVTPQNKNVWRLTLVAKDSELTETGIKEKTTHAKRYTYLLGPGETCKTAAERFETLSTETQITFQALVNAFSVEKLSKAFFDEYTLHYERFIEHLNKAAFKKSVFNGDEKAIRNFTKKLLGRIVFLYFVQKKGWLGASDTNYKDGMLDFVKKFFKMSGCDETFYTSWLTVLFFETLNKERTNDDFKMPDGKKVKVPFLNGGLFDREEHDEHILTFKPKLFHYPDFEDAILTEKNKTNSRGFLDFLNAFNFTVHEDSPDDHTVAVDPEMLGHIFENLLEDNKDKGAFYTPKEIVHYMCQESLTEYLTTHLSREYTVYKELGNAQVELFGNETKQGQLKMVEQLGDKALNRDDVAYIVKHKDISNLTRAQLKRIDQLLDAVKICDPAIGSGAFPMGLLQEIFAIKEVIAYELKQEWKPADVKEKIIQNSIYGVDIEKGAVDIARLRFWLSLVVDEERPRALPNLDYKIVVGDSLVSKFEGKIIEIDWERKSSVGKANEFVQNVQRLLKEIAEKQKKFFKPETKDKKKLHSEIRNLKLELLINQLSFNKEKFLSGNVAKGGFAPTASDLKYNVELNLTKKNFENLIGNLQNLKKEKDKPFEHFDWKLDFPEVLNPYLVNDEKQRGFDIVIGNPPYLRVQGLRDKYPLETEHYLKNYISATGRFDLYALFTEKSFRLLNKSGVLNFIQPDKWVNSDFGQGLRELLAKNVSKLFSFAQQQVFNVSTYSSIIWVTSTKVDYLKYNKLNKELRNEEAIGKFLNALSENDFTSQSTENLGTDPWILLDKQYFEIMQTIRKLPLTLKDIMNNISQGVVSVGDDIFIMEGKIKNGIFRGYSHKIEDYVEIEADLMRPLLKGDDVKKYGVLSASSYIIYPHYEKEGKTVPFEEWEFKSKFRKAYNYFLPYKEELIKKKIRYKTNPKYWYSLHRSREISLFEQDKIITPEISLGTNMTYDNQKHFHNTKCYSLIINEAHNYISTKSLLSILNSKLMWFFLSRTGYVLRGGFFTFKTNYLEPFPIPDLSKSKNIHLLENIVDYILFLKTQFFNEVADQLMPTYFEQIIDGMVYELYFPELLKTHKREIIKHLGELPEFIDKMSDEKKMSIVKTVFNRLNEREHPVRVNFFYMNSIPEIAIIEGKHENN